MTGYTAPLRDMRFVLEELIGLDTVTALPGFGDLDRDTVAAILDEAARFGADVLAPLNQIGDEVGCTMEDGVVRTPDGFRQAYEAFCAGGWNVMPFDPAIGGQGLPRLITTAVYEIWHGADTAFTLCPVLNQAAIELLVDFGSDELKQTYLPSLVSGALCAVMCMTEPGAGSDVGALRTRAERDGDLWRISGQKIFISWGDHDMTDNIIHMVLARAPDAPPGTRGLSLFLVPKIMPDTGQPNSLHTARLEKKLGMHASPTVEIVYDNAAAWLIGEENRGMACMFKMMNNTRLSVGHQGLGVTERAYQQALAYANERIQGRDIAAKDAAPVAIIHHGDVRRMLLTMKAHAEAMRALVYFTALSLDLATNHPEKLVREGMTDRVGLLTPIVKAWCTELGVEAASLGIQIHGGAGYIEETGAARHLRDARVTTIYEGTNGIHALDLVRRKLVVDGGQAARTMIEEIRQFDGALALTEGDRDMMRIRAALADGGAALARATEWISNANNSAPGQASAGAVPYLKLFGIVLGGWLMARAAMLAGEKLDLGAGSDAGFYRAKRATALFYAESVMAECVALERAATGGAEAVMALNVSDF